MILRVVSCLLMVAMVMADPLRFKPVSTKSTACPDQKSRCPDGQTCCLMPDSLWGCCPLPNAVCCSDKLHCCPKGATCSPTSGKCAMGNLEIDWFEKSPSLPVEEEIAEIENQVAKFEKVVQEEKQQANICPDGSSLCPDSATCCRMSDGKWGCCPLVKAVCCDDYKHCCPNGYTCAGQGQCTKGLESIEGFTKTPAQKIGKTMVTCPGGKVQCSSEQTCCEGLNGYQCCPLPQAVCCKDKKHCCPSGYICDDQPGICRQPYSGKTSALVQKVDGFPVEVSDISVRCSATRYCPDKQTCCKTLTGEWGCCPIVEAICCNDHLHCCPHGYTCDTTGGRCNKGNEAIPWLAKTYAMYAESVKCGNATPPAYECPANQTCCQGTKHQWGCCPLPKAVCCKDGIHCCPTGFACYPGRCVKGSRTIEWFEKKPEALSIVEAVQCPDHKHECPTGQTCCKLSSGDWGCCPLPNAVCCTDGQHCCPHGYKCEPGSGRCIMGVSSVEWFTKTVAKLPVRDVRCPGGQYVCPDGATCCEQSSGMYGCCPLLNAVCCPDKVHCCPNGYTCGSSGKCVQGLLQIEASKKSAAKKIETTTPPSVSSVMCPDGIHKCPDGQTCCKTLTGYGCCPLEQAVCCSDDQHCCPNGFTCDQGKCTRGDKSMLWFEKLPAELSSVESVICPDKIHECPTSNTCCKLSTGDWGCCPVPKAVCCSDGLHCCPNGYNCDSTGHCTSGDDSMSWLEKTPALPSSVQSVKCQDGSECPNGNTCCKLTTGQWGCCPIPKAVCCSDGLHCCPSGYSCESGQCKKGEISIGWFKKTAAAPPRVQSVTCPGGDVACPDGNTCCKLTSGQWGCCPVPNAVCCSDGIHCCPKSYTCNPGSGTCNKGEEMITALSQTEAQPIRAELTKEEGVKCNSTYSCPSSGTCCKTVDGNWACCPVVKAVCCSDHIHCCPQGTTCDVGQGLCLGKTTSTSPWLEKVAAVKRGASTECPDNVTICQVGNTCCRQKSGKWGCCEGLNAVCCSDGIHCCPTNMICDMVGGRCKKGNLLLDWTLKKEASRKFNDTVCPDGQHECPDGNTCCKLRTGEWGCCPLPNAVCCSDGEHCCPQGYTCNTITMMCQRGDEEIPATKKVSAKVRELTKKESTKCSKNNRICADGNTCCEGSDGNYGCCPLLEGTCCSNGRHCCAKGYKCDDETSVCVAYHEQKRWDALNFAKRAAKGGTILV